FGPGYEHWVFSRPEIIDADSDLYSMELLERGNHPTHHVAFVDCYNPHLLLYPESLSITFALWSRNSMTMRREMVRPIPEPRSNPDLPGEMANRPSLAKAPGDKPVEHSEFYPTKAGFMALNERHKWRGSNADYLYTLLHVLQKTGNEELVDELSRHLNAGSLLENPQILEQLLKDLRAGRPIESRFHFELPYPIFAVRDIERSLSRR
ncbi:MAG TPA: hypothetical protein VFT74_15710, partial [Isosphaeraceae bacterium]|nr:hypothetical protein [Isosphaeraceae bacterium]